MKCGGFRNRVSRRVWSPSVKSMLGEGPRLAWQSSAAKAVPQYRLVATHRFSDWGCLYWHWMSSLTHVEAVQRAEHRSVADHSLLFVARPVGLPPRLAGPAADMSAPASSSSSASASAGAGMIEAMKALARDADLRVPVGIVVRTRREVGSAFREQSSSNASDLDTHVL